MITFKKAPANKPEANKPRQLTAAELQTVSGGLNPQPLPPRWKQAF